MRTLVAVLLLTVLLSACTITTPSPSPPASQAPAVGIANPASENCLKQGGTLSIEKRGDGGEFGVCVFGKGMECEEWALLRGDCPVGGVSVAHAVTPAARYCLITGSDYTVVSNQGTEKEGGNCTFRNGKVCDAWDYFNGKCDPNS